MRRIGMKTSIAVIFLSLDLFMLPAIGAQNSPILLTSRSKGQGADHNEEIGITSDTYSISGYVRRYSTGAGVSGVMVTISATGQPTSELITDVNGYYEKTGLEPDYYHVEASSLVYVFSPPSHYVNLTWGSVDYINFTAFEPLQAEFSASPTDGPAPLEVNFLNQSTEDVTIYSWDFGDGNTSSEENPHYTYENFGIYSVSLTVINFLGTDIEMKENYITALARPIAVATTDKPTVNEGDTVTLYGNASYDPDGSIVQYFWEQITGPNATLSDANAVNPTFIAPDISGTRHATITFELTVTDNSSLMDSNSVIVTVTNLEPIYVNANAEGNDNGLSWTDAYNYLQDALAEANSISTPIEIWVAEGIYNPDANSSYPEGTGEREATFQLISGVAVYGGFPSSGGEWDERDPEAYETILSGDLDGNDIDVSDPCDLPTEPTRSENSYHVVMGGGTNETAVLNGFTITGGNANGVFVFPYYYGGGMYNSGGNPSPTVTNCTITSNSADYGGGIYNCDGPIINCNITGNWARYGGGIYNCDGPIANCMISSNACNIYGGGLSRCNGSITNCIITANRAYGGGGLYSCDSSITNCIVWANIADEVAQILGGTPAINYSDVQGGWPDGEGNIDADPCFVDPDSNDFHLLPDSPCVDAGDNNLVPADTADLDDDGDITEPTPFDLNRFPRFIDDLCTTDTGNGTLPIVDMGAYEFLRSDIDSSGGVDFVDFSRFALYWMDTSCGTCSGADLTCDGDVNWDDLKELTDNWLAGL